MRAPRPPRLTTLLLALVLVGGFVQLREYAAAFTGLDYYQFWVVGRALARGDAADLYSDQGRGRLGRSFAEAAARAPSGPRQAAVAARRATLQTYSTPVLYACLRPFALSSYDRAYALFQDVSTAAALGALALLARLSGLGAPASLAFAVAASLGFEPFLSDVRVGNVTRLQLALLVPVLLLLGRSGPLARLGAGALLGLAVLFKPSLAYVPLALLGGGLLLRRWRASSLLLAGLGVGALAAAGAAAALFGAVAVWGDWRRAVASLSEAITPVSSGNFSLARLLADGLGLHLSPLLAVLALGVPALVLLKARPAAPAPVEPQADLDRRLVALGCQAFLLAAPLVWTHYLLLCAPALAVCLGPGGGRRGRGIGLLALLLLAVNPLRSLLGLAEAQAVAMVTVAASLALWLGVLTGLGGGGDLPGGPRAPIDREKRP